MKIMLITPAARHSLNGNRATATRWARLLRDLGHRVTVAVDYAGEPADMMIALHAWRSAEAIRRFSGAHPDKPLAVVLTGTDIYKFQHADPEPTLESMARAHVLVGLHERVGDDIPPDFAAKLRTVFQSAEPPARRLMPAESCFEICVIGHLRQEKDPLRAAFAVRDVPEHSRLRVIQVGRAHDAEWHAAARAEMATNPRYHWHGEVPHAEVRRLMARARLMVISSLMEGGANVVSEACVAGLPVIASDIPGNRGLLGDAYPGCYPPADTAALRECLLRAEQDPRFVAALDEACRKRAPLFRPEAERQALQRLVDEVADRRLSAGPIRRLRPRRA